MATIVERSRLADELEDKGFIQARGVFSPGFMDSLLLKAHATLFRETAESRDAVKSNGSLIKLSDNPEKATGDAREIERYIRIFGDKGRVAHEVVV